MHGIPTSKVATLLFNNTPNLMILDVRRETARLKDGKQLPNTIWRNPALWLDWKDSIDGSTMVIVYCAHGQEIS